MSKSTSEIVNKFKKGNEVLEKALAAKVDEHTLGFHRTLLIGGLSDQISLRKSGSYYDSLIEIARNAGINVHELVPADMVAQRVVLTRLQKVTSKNIKGE